MMDNSSEATNSMNGDEKSSMWEALLSKMKVVSLEKDKKTLPEPDLVPLPEPDLAPRPSLSEQEKRLFIEQRSRALRRMGLVMERGMKKLEQAMKNRGLPVDKETLSSGASKDAFDLRGLNESLPSTSAQKPKDIEFTTKWNPNMESDPLWMRRSYERFERIRCSPSSYSSKLGIKMKDLGFLEGNNIKSRSFRLRPRRRVPAEVKETPASDEQKEKAVNNEIAQLRETLKILESHEAQLKSRAQGLIAGPSSRIAEAPRRFKLKKKSSDGGANLADMELPPSPSWDSEKIWTPEFAEPQSSVHHNSPTKWKVTFDQRDALRKCREENKLRILNTQRGVLTVDMDESGSENTTSDPIMPNYHFARTRLDVIRDLRKTLKDTKEMMRMRASPKSYRNYRRFIIGPNNELFVDNMNPDDKVLPD